MKVAYYFKNIEPTEAIKDYIDEKMAKLDSRFHHVEGADARLGVIRQNQFFEITIHADSTVFHIKKTNKDMYAAIDSCVDALQKQVDRHHKKNERVTAEPHPMSPALDLPDEAVEATIHVHDAPAKPMSDTEAILQLQAQKFRFLMFHHSNEKRYSFLFIRPDGNYSVISPTSELGQYEERVVTLVESELKTIAVSLYPMSTMTHGDAVDKLRESMTDFLVFVNEATRRMNLIFLGKHGELVIQRPPV